MKTAISIPDNLFQEADTLATKLGMNRSELYTKAIAKYINDQTTEGVTTTLNKVYSENRSDLDINLLQIQLLSIKNRDNSW